MQQTLLLVSRQSGPLGIVTLTGCLIVLLLATGCEKDGTGSLPYAMSAPGAVLDLGGALPALRGEDGVNQRAVVRFPPGSVTLRVKVRDDEDPLQMVEEFPIEDVVDGEDIVISGLPPGLGVTVIVEILDRLDAAIVSTSGIVDLVPGEVAVFVPDPPSGGSNGLPGTIASASFDSPGGLAAAFGSLCAVPGGTGPFEIVAGGVGNTGAIELGGEMANVGGMTSSQNFVVANGDGLATLFEATVRVTATGGEIFTGLVSSGSCSIETIGGTIFSNNLVGIKAANSGPDTFVQGYQGNTPVGGGFPVTGMNYFTLSIRVKSDGSVFLFADGSLLHQLPPGTFSPGTQVFYTARGRTPGGPPEGKNFDDFTVFTAADGSF